MSDAVERDTVKRDGVEHVESIAREQAQTTLFDLIESEAA